MSVEKNKSPKVSIVLTSYNHANYIDKTIESVLNQTYQDYELIILDNKSTDNSMEVIKSFNDKRIKVIENPNNIGMVMSINKGIEASSGQYIANLCADDIWKPTKLEAQMKAFELNKSIAATFTKVEVINESGEMVDSKHSYQRIFDKAENKDRISWLKYFFKHGNCICFPSSLVKKSVYNELGVFDSRYQIALDIDMWMRICMNYEIHIVEERLTNFRSGENSISSSDLSPFIFSEEMREVSKNFLNLNSTDFAAVFDIEEKLIENKKDKLRKFIEICLEEGEEKFPVASSLFFENYRDAEHQHADFIYNFFRERSKTLANYRYIRIGKTYKMVMKIKNIEKYFKKLIRR